MTSAVTDRCKQTSFSTRDQWLSLGHLILLLLLLLLLLL
ncbi:MAG: hypothetical protein ACI90V_007168, partial [Bacillariaceae sp.]